MRRITKLVSVGLLVSIVAGLGLVLHGIGEVTGVLAQTPVTNCSTNPNGGETCTFQSTTNLTGTSSSSAVLTVSINNPAAGLNIQSLFAADSSGDTCTTSLGLFTPNTTLYCGTFLASGANVAVTFSQSLASINATVIYNSNQQVTPAINSTTLTGTCTISNVSGTLAQTTGNFSCTNTTNTPVLPNNTITFGLFQQTPSCAADNSCSVAYTINSGPMTVGNCTFSSTTPSLSNFPPGPSTTPLNGGSSASPSFVETYQCVVQTTPSGTSITFSGTESENCSANCSSSITLPAMGEVTTMSANCPCAANSGPTSQTFIFQNPALGPTSTPAPTSTPTPTPAAGPTVTYPAGWNLASGPSGDVLAGAVLPIYTFQATDTSYESITTNVIQAPDGYWAYFAGSTTITLPVVSGTTQSVTLPSNHEIMIGNPFDRPATLSGSTSPAWVLIFNTQANTFGPWTRADSGQTVQLAAGQGAFVFAAGGGTLTITST